MRSRRSFFRAVGALVAAVAIAPAIAFNRKLETPEVEFNFEQFWFETRRYARCYSREYIDIMTDRATALRLQAAMINYYDSSYGRHQHS